jgi:tetratricopeptide (TPR) repeat protein
MGNSICREQDDYKEAIHLFTQAIDLKHDYSEAYISRGWTKYSFKDYQGAIEDINILITLDSKDANVLEERGVMQYFIMDDKKAAIDDLNQAILINPNCVRAYLSRALINDDDTQGAFEDYNNAIKIDPRSTAAYSYRASLKCQLKDYQGSIEDYSHAIEFFSLNNYSPIESFCQIFSIKVNHYYSKSYVDRGNVKQLIDDYDGAINDYSQAIAINPENEEAYNNRGDSRFFLKDYQGASNDYSQAISINPENEEAYNNRGDVKLLLKDYQSAIDDYTRTIDMDGRNYELAYRQRGLARYYMNDKQGAYNDWKALFCGIDLIRKYFPKGSKF